MLTLKNLYTGFITAMVMIFGIVPVLGFMDPWLAAWGRA